MLGIMADMDQKDFYTLVVGPDSGMCKVGFAGFRVDALAMCFDWFSSGPECSALRPVWTRRTVAEAYRCVSVFSALPGSSRIHAILRSILDLGASLFQRNAWFDIAFCALRCRVVVMFLSVWCLRFCLGQRNAVKGKSTINYFQYHFAVGCVCMLNDWIAALTIFAPTTTTTSGSS